MNRFIELHDATLLSLTFNQLPELLIHVCVHESEGKAGVDSGISYYQNALLHFDPLLEFSLAGDITEEPWIDDGRSVANGAEHPNSIPEAQQFDTFEIHATLTNGSDFVLRAGRTTIEFVGERSCIEKFPLR
ncbi:MAG: hypothetical protein U0136_13550 [Bdellovibrionota bacterium]